jgi:hypothetical protein
MRETLWSRARRDSNKWLLDHIVAWVLAFILPGVGTMLTAWLVPPNVDLRIDALLGFLGGVTGLGLLFAATYIWNLFRTPYRQRNESWSLNNELNQKMRELTTPRLELESEPIGEVNSDNNTVWNHLKVTNKAAVAIKGCYGQLVNFLDLCDEKIGIPPNSIRYAWTTNRGGGNCRTSDIGPGGWDYLDIICVIGNQGRLYTPVLRRDNWTRALLYPLPSGEYQVEIQVGSEVENFPPTNIHLKIEYKGGVNLHVRPI